VVRILAQPDDSTCGPTCLHAVYAHYGDLMPLDQVVAEVAPLPTGGTLGVILGSHALARGYDVTIYTYNLQVFDPTWFKHAGSPEGLDERLAARSATTDDAKLQLAIDAYRRFVQRGGVVRYTDLTRSLLADLLANNVPVLTGLSATYLYGCARERGSEYDDIGGQPTGHFVLLCNYDSERRTVAVADPLHDNPRFNSPHYRVGVDRLIGAILLGVVTYDANLLVIRPRETA
jgi:hypothetical protein